MVMLVFDTFSTAFARLIHTCRAPDALWVAEEGQSSMAVVSFGVWFLVTERLETSAIFEENRKLFMFQLCLEVQLRLSVISLFIGT